MQQEESNLMFSSEDNLKCKLNVISSEFKFNNPFTKFNQINDNSFEES